MGCAGDRVVELGVHGVALERRLVDVDLVPQFAVLARRGSSLGLGRGRRG